MMSNIGFKPNGVPPTQAPADKQDLDFDKLWSEVLDLHSAESRDAFQYYGRHRHA